MGWGRAALGSLTAAALSVALPVLVGAALDPYLRLISGFPRAGDALYVTVAGERAHGLLMGLAVLGCVLLSCFVGGVLSGRLASSCPGRNGAAVGVIVCAGALAWLLGILASVLGVFGGPGDAQSRSENFGMLLAALLALFAVSPPVALAGYWGGRVGGRLRA